MNSLVKRSLTLFLIGGITFFVGCSGDTPTQATNEAVTEEGVAEVGEAPVAKPVPVPVDVAQKPPAVPQDQASEIFQREKQERSLAAQKKEVLLQNNLLQAERLMQSGNLDQAEVAVFRALELDGANKQSLDLLQRILTMKKDPRAESANLATYLIDKRRLIRQARRAQVNDRFVKANQDFERGDFENAKIQLEEARTAMRFDEFQTDFGTLAQEVPDLLHVVGRRLEQQRKESDESRWRDIYSDLREKEARRKQQDAERVRRLMIEAIEAFQKGEFQNTEDLARRVLKLWPGHRKAVELIGHARLARHADWRETQYKQRRQTWQKWLEEIRETQIPYTGILSWVSAQDWQDLKRRRSGADAIAQKLQDTDAVRAIRAKLDNETVSLNFGEEETTLIDALKHLRVTQGINIVLDPEVASEKGEETVNISLTNHNLGKALKLMLQNLDLAHTFRDDVLYVTTKEKALGQPIPRVYSVKDLTISLPHFKAPDLNLRPGGTGEASKLAIWGEDLERTTDTTIDNLMDLIRENIGPGTWDGEGFGLNASAGQIVAVTTPQIHQQLAAFLDNLRQFSKLTVHVEARFISIDKATLDLVGNEFRGLGGSNPGTVALLDDISNGSPNNSSLGRDNGGAGLPAASSLSPSAGAFFNDNSDGDVRARTENIFDRGLGTLLQANGGLTLAFTWLDDLEVTSLLRAVEKSLNSTVVSAPRLTIYDNQRANLTLVNQISYVKDYDVEVAQTAFIADPLVDVVQDGLTLDVRPTVSHDRKYVTLEVQPTVAKLTRPIRTFETNLSGLTTTVIIELPELKVQSAATTVRVPDNGYLVIGGFKQISTVDRRSETPILSNIPILSFLFSTKGRSDEIQDLIILLHVQIVDLSERERDLSN